MRVTFRISGDAPKYFKPQRSLVSDVSDGMTCTHESHRGLGCVSDSVCGMCQFYETGCKGKCLNLMAQYGL